MQGTDAGGGLTQDYLRLHYSLNDESKSQSLGASVSSPVDHEYHPLSYRGGCREDEMRKPV